MTVLLAGCGDLGTEAGLRFAAAGHRVVGWRRSPEKLRPPSKESPLTWAPAELPPIPADTTAVVVAIAADSPTEEAYRAAYVDGLSNVLDAVLALRGKRPPGPVCVLDRRLRRCRRRLD